MLIDLSTESAQQPSHPAWSHWQKATCLDVEVNAGSVATLDFRLVLSKIEQLIQVNAAAAYARTITVLPREEVLDTPGRSIDESLRHVAGVNLQRDNSDVIFPLNPSTAMRGIGVGDTATRSLVLMDQLPLNGGFFGTVFWNHVPKYSVEQVEVVRGASSSLFGSFAEGGEFAGVPRETFNAFGVYSFGRNRSWEAGGGLYWAAKAWADTTNTFRVPAMLELDAIAAYRFGRRCRIQLNLNNLTNRRNYTSNGWGWINPGVPLSVFATLRYQF